MSALLLTTLVLLTAALWTVLHGVVTDDPRRSRTYTPPRSHHPDPFELRGSTYR